MHLHKLLFIFIACFVSTLLYSQTQFPSGIIIHGSKGGFIFHTAWQNGQDFLEITPDAATQSYNGNWDFNKSLRLEASGELVKRVSSLTGRAISVAHYGSGTRNFQVMGDGTIYGRELIVRMSNFPDYVFSNTHNRLSLDDLKTYIEEVGRLPKLPSATEAAEGVEVVNLTNTLTEKIEELTLYIIELHDRIKSLETELSSR